MKLDLETIRSTLATHALGQRIELHETMDSTNREAFALAQSGAAHGTVVIAESQSEGRGRLGRAWFSPPSGNLYCSVIVRRPQAQQNRLAEWLSWLPLTTALAAAEAVEALSGVRVFVKWPNDLLMREQKIGGILCENGVSPFHGPFQVIGIGINVNGSKNDFPREIVDQATTVSHETGHPVDRNQMFVRLLLELEHCIDELTASGQTRLAFAYRQRCATLGRTVRASFADGNEFIGIAEDIGQDGSLLVAQRPASPNGRPPVVRHLRAADIIHLRAGEIGR